MYAKILVPCHLAVCAILIFLSMLCGIRVWKTVVCRGDEQHRRRKRRARSSSAALLLGTGDDGDEEWQSMVCARSRSRPSLTIAV